MARFPFGFNHRYVVMGKGKKLDDILREHLSDFSVPYEGADWEKAQLLLPKQKTSSFWRFARGSMGLFALLAIFGAGYWLGTKQTAPSRDNPVLASKAPEQIPPASIVGTVSPNNGTAYNLGHKQETIHISSSTRSSAKTFLASPSPSVDFDSVVDYARPNSETTLMGSRDVQVLKSAFSSPAQFLNLPLDQLVWLAFNPLHKTENEPASTDRYLSGNQLGIAAGAGLFQSFQSTAGFTPVINPSIGLMLMHWKHRFGISLGAIYTPRGGVNTQYTYTQTTYNFESKVDTGFVFTRQLHLVDVPVLLHYQIHPKHFVSFGPSISWLVNTTSTTQLVGEQAKTGMLGYHGGFRLLDWGLEGGWGMQINRTLGLNVTAHVGMRDLTRNDVYHDAKFDRNLGLRVMLRYKLYANR